MATPAQVTGRVLNVQRMSTEDGPGIRTTVFFKGCPLWCDWCHNPESLSPAPEVVRHEARCISCGDCARACPHGCDPAACTACGRCAEACPAGAREVLGVEREARGLVADLLRDRAYFGPDGGVTLSGGEPTLQPAFAAAVLDGCRDAGVTTAIDTCGECGKDVLLDLAGRADLVLFDVKVADPEAHRRHTGHSNRRILANLAALVSLARSRGERPALWVRTPLIPGATATPANVTAIGALLSEVAGGLLDRWELCAFNPLCRDQYRRLGREWAYAEQPATARSDLDDLLRAARSSGPDPARVHVTGAARAEGGRP